jgi:CO/xanthine dehydrogenase FAD-binding subunit
MDLLKVDSYISPNDIQAITNWCEGHAWLAGGTWLFSEPQPHLKTLVDMQLLGWSEIEIIDDYLVIGATCPLVKLLEYPWKDEWIATRAFTSAISALAASLKVINVATVGGNICLALSVGTLAPVMIALNAKYELWNCQGESRQVAAKEFQIAHRQTILQLGEVLRKVLIPLSSLIWKIDFHRFGIATSDPALAIVVIASNSENSRIKLVISASVTAPLLLEFNDNINLLLDNITFIDDAKATALYRREMTLILIKRSLKMIAADK